MVLVLRHAKQFRSLRALAIFMLLALNLNFSRLAHANEFMLKTSDCDMRALRIGSKRWKKLLKPLKSGTTVVQATERASTKSRLFFKLSAESKILMAAPRRCFDQISGEDDSTSEKQDDDSAGAISTPAASSTAASTSSTQRPMIVSIGGLSWQENLTLSIKNSKNQFNLKGTNFGFSLQVEKDFAQSFFDWGLAVTGFFGKSYVKYVLDPEVYSATNASVFGAMPAVQILLKPLSGDVRIGINAGAMIRYGAYPDPIDEATDEALASVDGKFKILPGAMFLVRFEKEPFVITQHLGFLGSIRNYSWAFLAGYQF